MWLWHVRGRGLVATASKAAWSAALRMMASCSPSELQWSRALDQRIGPGSGAVIAVET